MAEKKRGTGCNLPWGDGGEGDRGGSRASGFKVSAPHENMIYWSLPVSCTQPSPPSGAEGLTLFPPFLGEGAFCRTFCFPDEARVKFQGQKLALGLGKKTPPNPVNLGGRVRFQCGHSRYLGVLAGTGTLIPPAKICLTGNRWLHNLEVTQTTTSISPLFRSGGGDEGCGTSLWIPPTMLPSKRFGLSGRGRGYQRHSSPEMWP